MTKETIFAHTEPVGQYPAYINLSRTDGGLRRLTVRSRGNDGRDTAFIDLTPFELAGLAASILSDTIVAMATTTAAPILDTDAATTLPEASPATKGQCNDERACGACFSGQRVCTGGSQ